MIIKMEMDNVFDWEKCLVLFYFPKKIGFNELFVPWVKVVGNTDGGLNQYLFSIFNHASLDN